MRNSLIAKLSRHFARAFRDELDEPLMMWKEASPYLIRWFLNHLLVIGGSGSGKTSSCRSILKAVLQIRNRNGFLNNGGAIFGAKSSDEFQMRQLFAELGQSDRLIVLGPTSQVRINLLEYMLRKGDARQVTSFISASGEPLRAGLGGSRGDVFFPLVEDRLIYSAVVVLRLAGKLSASALVEFINTSAQQPSDIMSSAWQGCFHHRMFDAALNAPKTTIEQHDFDRAFDLYYVEWPQVAFKTKSCILAGIMNTLSALASSWAMELVSQSTNFDLDEVIYNRKWLFVNCPPLEMGITGKAITASVKLALQHALLLRDVKPGDPIVCLWCDEASEVLTSFDSRFMSQVRSRLATQVLITQGVASITGAFNGNEKQTIELISNFGTKLFFALGTSDDAEFASRLCGTSLECSFGGSIIPQQDVFDSLVGTPQHQLTFSESWQPSVQPLAFMSGLRTGGPPDFLCDAIAVKTGVPFPGTHGKNYQLVTFSQR